MGQKKHSIYTFFIKKSWVICRAFLNVMPKKQEAAPKSNAFGTASCFILEFGIWIGQRTQSKIQIPNSKFQNHSTFVIFLANTPNGVVSS